MKTKITQFTKILLTLVLIISVLQPISSVNAASSCSCLVYYTKLTGLPATGDANFAAKNYPSWLSQMGYGVVYYSSPKAGLSMTMDSTRSGSPYGHIAYIESASYNSTTGAWTIVLWDTNFNWSGTGVTILKNSTHADCTNVKRVKWVTKNLSGLKFFKWTTCKSNKTNPMYTEYFNNTTFTQPARMIRCESQSIDRPWGSISPTWKNLSTSDNYKVIGVGSDNFSIRWTGPFNLTNGTYYLYGGVDDMIKIYVNGVKIYGTEKPLEYNTTKYITNGQTLKLEYTEKYYSASFSFKWIKK